MALFIPLFTWLGMAVMPVTRRAERADSLADCLLSRQTLLGAAVVVLAFLVSRVLGELSLELTAVARGVDAGELERGRGVRRFLFALTADDSWYEVWFQTAGWWAGALRARPAPAPAPPVVEWVRFGGASFRGGEPHGSRKRRVT